MRYLQGTALGGQSVKVRPRKITQINAHKVPDVPPGRRKRLKNKIVAVSAKSPKTSVTFYTIKTMGLRVVPQHNKDGSARWGNAQRQAKNGRKFPNNDGVMHTTKTLCTHDRRKNQGAGGGVIK